MEIGKNKILILSLSDVMSTASGKDQAEDITDFRLKKKVLDSLCSTRSLVRLYLYTDEDMTDKKAMVKAIELFIFVYCGCSVAVRLITSTDGLVEGLPHNIRKGGNIITTNEEVAESLKISCLPLYDVLCMQ